MALFRLTRKITYLRFILYINLHSGQIEIWNFPRHCFDLDRRIDSSKLCIFTYLVYYCQGYSHKPDSCYWLWNTRSHIWKLGSIPDQFTWLNKGFLGGFPFVLLTTCCCLIAGFVTCRILTHVKTWLELYSL